MKVGVPPQIKNLHLDFTFETLEVKFENLLGGGSLETLVETVINELGIDDVFSNNYRKICLQNILFFF